jgi:hypothetical protein
MLPHYNVNGFDSTFEEFRYTYPVYYFDYNVAEMLAILRNFGLLGDDLENGVNQIILNRFVMTADEGTITALERFLYIKVNRTKPLDFRRKLILSLYVGSGKMSATKIREIFAVFTSAKVNVRLETGYIEITINGENVAALNLADATDVLLRKIPAHLGLGFVISPPPYEGIDYSVGVMTESVSARFFGTDPIPPFERVEYSASTMTARTRENFIGYDYKPQFTDISHDVGVTAEIIKEVFTE